MKDQVKVITLNRKARHDYHIEETYEAGISLVGTEVKSLRLGRVSIKESFARVENGQVYIYDLHISPYEQGNRFNHDPKRRRKLLLHKSEIRRLIGRTQQQGYTLIPLRLYFRRGLAKLEIGVAKGKKLYDKRREIAERDARREAERAMRKREYN